MLFSSPIFLFAFLPIVLLLYYLVPTRAKNLILLVFSLFFYAWGEVFYLGVMLCSIVLNYGIGLLVGQNVGKSPSKAKLWLTLGVFLNLLLLVSFKYANFIVDNINVLCNYSGLDPVILAPVHLPLGISFFTFQALSYVVDVYRKEVPAQKNILDLALFVALFPQLIAGPIVRYHDIVTQFKSRSHRLSKFASGVERFIYGLAKKMLIANALGQAADSIFSIESVDLTLPVAWLGIISYALQIYFDFSGYSDMAIGLGRMFGFEFLENFNYPYIACSVREFWRRWHISLSTWFRDYVYIPLGGSRVPTWRVYLNLFLVFLLTGIWHGASWNFIIWGLFHGSFLAIEHAGFSKPLQKLWRPVQHLYLLVVVLVGWVFFRAETLGEATFFVKTMFSLDKIKGFDYMTLVPIFPKQTIYCLALGLILSIPVYEWLKSISKRLSSHITNELGFALFSLFKVGGVGFLFYLSMLKIAASTYNPFIYFRF
jgi:alginate O-acetyltransferase complex protein AlgI